MGCFGEERYSKATVEFGGAQVGAGDCVRYGDAVRSPQPTGGVLLTVILSTLARDIKADTQDILNDTSAIKEDTTQILATIARLQEQLPRDGNHLSAGFMLERYLDNLTTYAETVCDGYSDGSDESRLPSRPGSSGEDDWDSFKMVEKSTAEMEKAKLIASLERERREKAEIETQKKNIEQELENLTTALFEEANKVGICLLVVSSVANIKRW